MKNKKLIIFSIIIITILLLTIVPTSSATYPLKIHILNVGQADCILIQSDNYNMLIDAGNNADSSIITSYIDNLKIKSFDYVIGTHPHEDHIGSLDTIINKYTVDKILMPRVTTTTRTFEDVIKAITAKNLKITTPVVGTKYNIGKAKFQIIVDVK